jgi:SAM-dependent methyltransferase
MTSRNPRPGERVEGICPLCDSRELRLRAFRYTFHDRFLYGTQCTRCSLVFIQPQPSRDEIRDMYSEEYFVECSESCGAHGRHAYMEEAAQSGADRVRAARRLERLALSLLERRGRLLEIGCGPGFLLDAFRKLGWEVAGLEISPFAVRHAREQLHLSVELGDVEPDRFPERRFEMVFMGDVVEHLPDPLASLTTVRRWLVPGGIAIIAVPSTLNLLSARAGLVAYRMQGRFKTLRIPPYHLFEYTPATLERMIKASGLVPQRIVQSAVPLTKMGLRGTPIENVGKAALQLLAHATARLFNRGGDRLLAIVLAPKGQQPGQAAT